MAANLKLSPLELPGSLTSPAYLRMDLRNQSTVDAATGFGTEVLCADSYMVSYIRGTGPGHARSISARGYDGPLAAGATLTSTHARVEIPHSYSGDQQTLIAHVFDPPAQPKLTELRQGDRVKFDIVVIY
jgi:hypothetical protein